MLRTRWQRCTRFLRCLLWLVVAMLPIAPAAATPAADFPRPVSTPLARSFQILAEGNPLSDAVEEIRQRTGLRVWIDRRVDPSLPLLSGTYGATTREVIERLAAENALQVGTADEIVLLGPGASVNHAASEMMAARDRLRQWQQRVAAPNQSPLTTPRPIAWPMLSTPAEALAVVADSWDLDISAVSLPHDLWPAVDLGEVDVTTALGVIGVGFDLALDLEPSTRRVTPRPLRSAPLVVRQYPAGALSPDLRNQITSSQVGGQLRKQDERWSLRGPARAHALLEAAVSVAAGSVREGSEKSGAPAAMSASGQRFSLRLVNKPAGDFLRAICQSAGWQLEVDPAAAERLDERIDLQVDEATLDELVEQALTPLGLETDRQGTRLRISLPDAPQGASRGF